MDPPALSTLAAARVGPGPTGVVDPLPHFPQMMHDNTPCLPLNQAPDSSLQALKTPRPLSPYWAGPQP